MEALPRSSTRIVAGLVGRVRGEVGADQPAVPRPVVLGVGGRVHADVTAAAGDVGLEGGLLGGVEHVAGGGEPDHRLVLGQVGGGELGGVLGRGHREPVGARRVAGSRRCRCGIDECRKPAVLEKTRTLVSGAAAAGAATATARREGEAAATARAFGCACVLLGLGGAGRASARPGPARLAPAIRQGPVLGAGAVAVVDLQLGAVGGVGRRDVEAPVGLRVAQAAVGARRPTAGRRCRCTCRGGSSCRWRCRWPARPCTCRAPGSCRRCRPSSSGWPRRCSPRSGSSCRRRSRSPLTSAHLPSARIGPVRGAAAARRADARRR